MLAVTLSRFSDPSQHLLAAVFPYDEGIRSIIRDVPGRKWDETRKLWLIPDNPDSVLALRERLAAVRIPLNLTPDVRDYLNAAYKAKADAHAIRAAGDADIDFAFVTQPYAHQRAGLAFLARLGGGALLWEMGLGKTKTAIDFAEWLAGRGTPSPLRVLVICPNTIKRNWAHEIELHAGHADHVVLDGSITDRVKRLGTRRYSIVNCEALSIAAFAKAAQAREWDLVIVDESTRFKSPKASRTKALHKLRTRHRVALTGTPITGKPEDAWSQFEFVAPGLFGRNFYQFADRYLQKDYWGAVQGVKPEKQAELRSRIDSHAYRILKADVLDLPPKVYTDRVVTLEGEQARAYRTMKDELRLAYEGGEITAFNVLTQLLRLTQITGGLLGEQGRYQWLHTGNAKLMELDAIIEELGDEPVVIFGLYQRELEELALRYSPVRPSSSCLTALQSAGAEARATAPIIYGPTPEKRRHELIESFQAGQINRLFVQSQTGGIGITLTAARTAIYYTRGWGLEEYLQSQDRLHRIGQTGTVSIIHLVAENTVDEEIAEALRDKRALADDLTGDTARELARRVLGVKR